MKALLYVVSLIVMSIVVVNPGPGGMIHLSSAADFPQPAAPQPPAPSVTTEKKTLHMSFAESGQHWQSTSTKRALSLKSDEYWFRVSGAQLTRGVGLDISHPGALVRLTALSGHSERSKAINPEELDIYQNHEKQEDAIENIVTQYPLASSTLFQRTAVFRFSEKTGTGHFELRSAQRLVDNDPYIVNVKETGSRQMLHMSSEELTLFAGDTFHFNALVKQDTIRIPDAEYQAYLQSPTGHTYELSLLEGDEGQWQTRLPSTIPQPAPGELFELYMNVVAGKKGQQVRRTAKLPFSIATPTARLEGITPVMTGGIAATVYLNVTTEGRYGLRGTIYGTSVEGKLLSIMRSHSAYWLEAGGQSIDLVYDENILKKSNLQPPYTLKDLALIDQGKLSVLHTQPQVD